MRRMIAFATGVIFSLITLAQNPQGISYQAAIRNDQGDIIANQNISLRVSLQDQEGSNVYYKETHTLQTNSLGIVNITIGDGNTVSGSFVSVPWSSEDIYLKIEVDPNGGSSYSVLGTTKLQSVPFALHAQSASEIITQTTNEDDPLFVVRNNAGQIVFAVYQTGVRIYVEDDEVKSTRGGFAIGGLSDQTKEDGIEYMRVTPDSARIYLRNPVGKQTRGGFAVGGLSDQTKQDAQDLLFIAPDSARIWVKSDATRGTKGGFAIGGFSSTKSDPVNLMHIEPENYFIGHSAGMNTTTGEYNTFFGFESGFTNTEGSGNVFIGFESGFLNEDGEENVFIGNEAGYSNTTGISNVYIGNASGYSSDTAVFNVFLGNYTGFSNTNGSSNVFIGDAAGEDNTLGSSNIFIGDWTGKSNTIGESNVFLGADAGWSNLIGSYNVFLGTSAGYSNTEGEGNVFLGDDAGYYNTIGIDNVFLGGSCGYNNTSGEGNVFLGSLSGFANKTGTNNVYLGAEAGYSNVAGMDNIFIGTGAGYYETGSGKLYISGWDADSTETLVFGNFEEEILQVNYSLGVGRYPENNALEVEGDILATGGITPDYVFEEYFRGNNQFKENYKFLSLQKVEEFIREEGHLPGVTSYEETQKQGGIIVNKVPYENLEKIEELYLHLIELEKRIKKLEKENEELKLQIDSN